MSLVAHPSMEDLLTRLDTLQVFPAAAVKVAEVARRRGSSLDDMEKAASSDAALTGRLLKLANSPFYGMSREVKTLKKAVQVLGFHATRDLAISSAMAAIGADAGPLGQALWAHSLGTGVGAAAVAGSVHGVDKAQAFVAGLLLDLGQMLLLAVERDSYTALYKAFPDPGKLVAAERFTYGFDHARLGAACLRRWSLPEAICAAVEQHHGREWSGNFADRLLPAVRLADAMAHYGVDDPDAARVAAKVADLDEVKILGLDDRRLLQITERGLKEAKAFSLVM